MLNKIIINLDATVLDNSSCILSLIRSTVGELDAPELGAYKGRGTSVNLAYGVAVHTYIDTMYKTGGHIPTARTKSNGVFTSLNPIPDKKKGWMSELKHLQTTCHLVWSEHIEQESGFKLLDIQQKCYYCGGKGGTFKPNLGETTRAVLNEPYDDSVIVTCDKCDNTGLMVGPATEINFKIPYYEDDYIKVYLCGTIDRFGKFNNGIYCIRDWKTTGSWSSTDYFKQYELSRQLRMYVLALKLMAQMFPESVLGKAGSTTIGVAIDAIFLSANANDTEVKMSEVFPEQRLDIAGFQRTLDDKIQEISRAVQTRYLPKQGILHGTCERKFQKCQYWNCCFNSEEIAQILLNRDFERKNFDPLNYNK